MIYTGERISLRHVTTDDIGPLYLTWLNDPQVNQYLEVRWDPQTMESIRSFVMRMSGDPDTILLAIIENYTSQHIGNLKIGPINRHHQYADISYFIGNRAYWNNGFATEAIKAALHIGFSDLSLHSIRAGVYGANIASQRVLEKCGFTKRGAYPDELADVTGQRQDHLLYSITKPEWMAQCAPQSNSSPT
jgi:[ribosomal protein S5]-alanine N-acetyltransferase